MRNILIALSILSFSAYANDEQEHFDDLVLRVCEGDSNAKCVNRVAVIQAKRARRVEALHVRQAKKLQRLNKKMAELQEQALKVQE